MLFASFHEACHQGLMNLITETEIIDLRYFILVIIRSFHILRITSQSRNIFEAWFIVSTDKTYQLGLRQLLSSETSNVLFLHSQQNLAVKMGHDRQCGIVQKKLR